MDNIPLLIIKPHYAFILFVKNILTAYAKIKAFFLRFIIC